MATKLFTLTDPTKPVVKIIRVQEGEVIVNYAHPIEGALVAWALKLAKVRSQLRALTEDETKKAWDEQAALQLGSGI